MFCEKISRTHIFFESGMIAIGGFKAGARPPKKTRDGLMALTKNPCSAGSSPPKQNSFFEPDGGVLTAFQETLLALPFNGFWDRHWW
jgi:hypothetical protein